MIVSLQPDILGRVGGRKLNYFALLDVILKKKGERPYMKVLSQNAYGNRKASVFFYAFCGDTSVFVS